MLALGSFQLHGFQDCKDCVMVRAGELDTDSSSRRHCSCFEDELSFMASYEKVAVTLEIQWLPFSHHLEQSSFHFSPSLWDQIAQNAAEAIQPFQLIRISAAAKTELFNRVDCWTNSIHSNINSCSFLFAFARLIKIQGHILDPVLVLVRRCKASPGLDRTPCLVRWPCRWLW